MHVKANLMNRKNLLHITFLISASTRKSKNLLTYLNKMYKKIGFEFICKAIESSSTSVNVSIFSDKTQRRKKLFA